MKGGPVRNEPEPPIEARLIRELIDWLDATGRIPMLLAARSAVRGEMPGVAPDAEHVVLNVSSRAVRELTFGADEMSFSTGFGPVRAILSIPYGAVLQIASGGDENFVGAILRREPELAPGPPPAPTAPSAPDRPKVSDEAKRRFRVVRDDEGESG